MTIVSLACSSQQTRKINRSNYKILPINKSITFFYMHKRQMSTTIICWWRTEWVPFVSDNCSNSFSQHKKLITYWSLNLGENRSGDCGFSLGSWDWSFAMGLLTNPNAASGVGLVSLLQRYSSKLSWLCYLIGALSFFVFAHPEFSHKTYFSENALLPGLVKAEFNEERAITR